MKKGIMKKGIPCFIIGILVLSGLGAVAIQEQDELNILMKSDVMNIATPTIREENGFVTLELDIEDATYLSDPGKPMVPVVANTFMFPAGTVIDDVVIDVDYQKIELENKIMPSPIPVPYSSDVVFHNDAYEEFNETVYSSEDFYPSEPYVINYGIGINEMEHVTYVTVRSHAQYSPANDYINVPRTINYDIEYTEPLTSPFVQTSEPRLLIVTHEVFEDEMLRLRDHKIDTMGIPTDVVTVDTILESYTEGVADWENVKLFLADRVQFGGVRYALFAGGTMGQTHKQWVPAFESNNWDGAHIPSWGGDVDVTYFSDLYFADLFSYDGLGNPMFSSWDTTGDGNYAVGPYVSPTNYDTPDYYPDVYFGRLPLRYSWDAKTAVDKIIEYETMPAEPDWFRKAVFCGGDTSPDFPGYAGEMICDHSASILETAGFETYRMYLSTGGDHHLNNGEPGSGADEVADVLSHGAGWFHVQSHANPAVMGNHPPRSHDFTYYFTIMDMNLFVSDGKYPFMVLDGCTNAKWGVSLQYLIDQNFQAYDGIRALSWIPTDVTSWMVLKANGGGITAIGNTALGYGNPNDPLGFFGGWIMPRFSRAYAIEGIERTGEIWVYGITEYINNFDVLGDRIHRKTIEQRGLLGDPSIRLGGSGGVAASDDESEPEPVSEYMPAVTTSSPTWNVGDTWTYNLNTIDFTMQELEDRGIDLKLSAGTIDLEVVESRALSYVTKVSCDNIDVAIELIYNSYTDDPTIFVLPPVSFEGVGLSGTIVWQKDTLAIMEVDLSIYLDIMDNLDGLPIQIPGFVSQIIEILPISIPVQLDLSVDFENPWPLFSFPFVEGKEWGIPEGVATVTIGGSVQSPWLRLVSIVNRFVPLIPPEFAQYLPNVDIAEVLEDFGIPSVMDIEIPYVGEVMRKSPFEVYGQETVNVGAGSFSATRILVLGGVGNMYYSDSANNFVLINSPANAFLPAINNINLELIE